MSAAHDDELKPTTTEGYKVGEKKTVEEYAKLDAEDESLARWKASLGIGAAAATGSIGEPGDNRTVVILELALIVAGRPDVVLNLDSPDAVSKLEESPFTVKEGAEYRMRVKFRVQHEVISGLRYLQLVKRKGIPIDKSDQMMGSYSPNTKENPFYEKTFSEEEAPSGMLYRGTYQALSKFMDDDHKEHMSFKWTIEIKKSWE
ncbi:rho guanidine dissociation inhibitor [Pyronema domesticum]|uniref:Rho GDP-dissociation inhibitor n=1 Tax=Pyronema omphalodes (strain CBS 100304) TaxID=1076935 RepID=U4KXV2_PYROM|nr:rho guanidine dissociation inhibitor [Pyronema domesticum]CCX06686.1 Similar to Rho GDP-dissociation inhibitor; acc. no. Q12434 [Pyronema omphalodes CBS 100304]